MANRDSREDAIVKNAALITSRLGDKLEDITSSIQQLLVADISELRGDEQLLQLLRDTVTGNIDTFFAAIRNGIPVEHIAAPTAALEYARRLAQREVSANALTRAYRLGHRVALKFMLDEIRASQLAPELSLDIYARMEAISFGYIDEVSQRVVAAYQDERERWVENRNRVRAEQVRELLSGTDVDLHAMTTAIRYPLNRIHVAVMCWCREAAEADELGSMERFVKKVAESIGAQESPLFIAVDRVTAWAWIPLPPDAAPNAVAQIRAFRAADCPCVAVGTPLPGVGIRTSRPRPHTPSQPYRAQPIIDSPPQAIAVYWLRHYSATTSRRRQCGSATCSARFAPLPTVTNGCGRHCGHFWAPVRATRRPQRSFTYIPTP